MWLILAFASAALHGCYDICKKRALLNNAVLPVLFFNTLFSALIFLPLILSSVFGWGIGEGTLFEVPTMGWEAHKYVFIKACIVLTSWTFGYVAMKHLPITIVGPINATRPVGVLIGAMLIFGEHIHAKDRRNDEKYGKFSHTNADGSRVSGAPVGCGILPLEKIVKSLVNDGFEGIIIAEHSCCSDQQAALLESITNLKKWCGQE